MTFEKIFRNKSLEELWLLKIYFSKSVTGNWLPEGVTDYTSIDVTLLFKFWKLKCLEALVIDYKCCVIDYTSLKWFKTVKHKL